MRLIDADALAYEILSEYGADGGTEDVNTIYGMIINAPTIDAEPVVRCMDCKHYSVEGETNHWEGICGNENSDYAGAPTLYDDTCEDWEERE